jgi:hypothetical protein
MILKYLFFVLLIFSLSSFADTIYVNANALTGKHNGSSWSSAYSSLPPALARAVKGDEIWVAAGQYQPGPAGNRSFSFQLNDSIALYGGFTGNEVSRTLRNWDRNLTILSGDLAGNDSTGINMEDNAFHVLKGANGAVLDGFTITGGNADSTGWGWMMQ